MSDRIHPAAIEASGLVGDGSRALHDDGTWKVPASTTTTALVPLTTTVAGEPALVWDDDDNLVMTEVPR